MDREEKSVFFPLFYSNHVKSVPINLDFLMTKLSQVFVFIRTEQLWPKILKTCNLSTNRERQYNFLKEHFRIHQVKMKIITFKTFSNTISTLQRIISIVQILTSLRLYSHVKCSSHKMLVRQSRESQTISNLYKLVYFITKNVQLLLALFFQA